MSTTTEIEPVVVQSDNTAKPIEEEPAQPVATSDQQEASADVAPESLLEDGKLDEESKDETKKRSSNRTRNKRKKKTALPVLNLGSDAFVPDVSISFEPVTEPKQTPKTEDVTTEGQAAPEKKKRAKKAPKDDEAKE
jgi:hypothetical protein